MLIYLTTIGKLWKKNTLLFSITLCTLISIIIICILVICYIMLQYFLGFILKITIRSPVKASSEIFSNNSDSGGNGSNKGLNKPKRTRISPEEKKNELVGQITKGIVRKTGKN